MIQDKVIGYDCCSNPIHIGDTIMDDAGRRYVIDEWGRPTTDAGQRRQLEDLSEVLVIRTATPKPVTMLTFTPNAKPSTDEDSEEKRKAKAREYQRSFRERHKAELTAKRRQRRLSMTAADHAREAAAQKRYYDAHRAAVNARAKERREANPEKTSLACLKYYSEHKDRINAQRKQNRLEKRRSCFNCASCRGVDCVLLPAAPVRLSNPSKITTCPHFKIKTK